MSSKHLHQAYTLIHYCFIAVFLITSSCGLAYGLSASVSSADIGASVQITAEGDAAETCPHPLSSGYFALYNISYGIPWLVAYETYVYGGETVSVTKTFDKCYMGGATKWLAYVRGVCTSVETAEITIITDQSPTTASVQSPSGIVYEPFDIVGSVTFKPTNLAVKGYITPSIYSPEGVKLESLPTKECTTETCSYSYLEMSGELYHWFYSLGDYKVSLYAKSCPQALGSYIYSDYLPFTVAECQCDLSSISISPSEVRPAKTGEESLTKAAIGIALAKPAPSYGCEIKLRIEPAEGTGGHSHDGNRKAHTGKVEPDSILFVPGESLLNAEYTSGEVAGTEKIIAESLDSNGSVLSTQSVSIDVKFPGLEPLSGSEYYTLSGATSGHSSNHYGQFWMNWMIDFVANDYFEETEAILGVNDMSLEWGGLFDIGPPDGAFWSTPHKSHRKGTSVDIDRTAYKTGAGVQVDRKILDRIARYYDGIKVVEPTIHYEFR